MDEVTYNIEEFSDRMATVIEKLTAGIESISARSTCIMVMIASLMGVVSVHSRSKGKDILESLVDDDDKIRELVDHVKSLC